MRDNRLFRLGLVLAVLSFVQESPAQTKLSGHRDWVNSVAFSPDGKLLATARDNNRIELWDSATRTDTELDVITSNSIAILGEYNRDLDVRSVAFSKDGKELAGAYSDDTVKLWDVAAREIVATLEGHGGPVAFSRDGTLLASGGDGIYNRAVVLRDLATREVIGTLEGHTREVNSLAFSQDGILASGSDDGAVKLWDVATREEIGTLEGHTREVNSLAFSRDGILASGSRDATVKLWDVTTTESIATLRGHTDEVTSVAFSRDGILASGSEDATVKLWDIAPHRTSQPPTPTQPGSPDFDGDGTVGFSDFLQFAAQFGLSQGDEEYDPRFDLDGNGAIGFGDFLIFASAFGNSTGST